MATEVRGFGGSDLVRPLILLLPWMVTLQLSSATFAVQPLPGAAQQSELQKAQELNNQIIKLFGEGKYREATVLAEQALKIREKVLGPEHPDTLTILGNLAVLLNNQARYAEAELLYQRNLKALEKVQGPEHPDTALALSNLAELYRQQARYAEAEPLYKRALKIQERVLGPEHSLTATTLNNLAVLYDNQANYAAAAPLHLRTLRIREKVLGMEHSDTALSANNLAENYRSQANYAAAEPLYQRALKTWEKVLGPEHPLTALCVSNLALLHFSQGNYTTAEPLWERALKTREKVLGPEHPLTASSIMSLAELYRSQGNYEAAEPLYERALKIQEKVVGAEHPDTAISLNNLGFLHVSQGNHAAAETYYQRALKIREKVLGPEHPETALNMNNLALLYCRLSNFSDAASLIDRERRGQRSHVSRVLSALSAREQEMFLRSHYTLPLYSALTLGLVQAADSDLTSQSASWLINGKGVVQEALAQRNLQIRDLNDSKLAPVVRELEKVRTRMASLAMNAALPGQEEQRRTELDRLNAEEQQLASQLGDPNASTSEWVEISQVQKALPTDSILIDIARFNVLDFNAKDLKEQFKPAHYVAWITSPSADPRTVLVDLGDAEAIDQLVSKVRQQIAADAANEGTIAKDGEDSAVAALMTEMSALADLIWKPLAPHVGDAKQIVLSPDGALWLAPWSALPTNEAGDEYLLERCDLRMIVSGRDLLAAHEDRKTAPPVILANPNFDQQESQKKSAIKGIFRTLPPESENATRSFSAQSTLPKVQALPNTGVEALAIQPHLETYTNKKVSVYQEQYALERVARVLRSPQIVTFATHGFFLPTQETKPEDLTLAMSNSTRSVTVDANGQLIENPLLRCGLLLSGCNNRGATVADDDGILTGMEITGIDFRGTELVVLSACETGIGDVKSGEGVAGLRQAFQLAGAEAVVSTLWQVPDRDSALLMSKFFEELAGGKTKSEALRAAQLERIEKRRERYGAAHPFFWAAFTLTGQ